jgi:hypothetical protein
VTAPSTWDKTHFWHGGKKISLLCCNINSLVWIQYYLRVIFDMPYTTHNSLTSHVKSKSWRVNMPDSNAKGNETVINIYHSCIIMLQFYHQNNHDILSYKHILLLRMSYSKTQWDTVIPVISEMRVLIHNATVYIPEAADARCLNYEGRETYPNTPQLTELVTKDCSHKLQNLLHISVFWCAIIEVCMFPSTWGGSDT